MPVRFFKSSMKYVMSPRRFMKSELMDDVMSEKCSDA